MTNNGNMLGSQLNNIMPTPFNNYKMYMKDYVATRKAVPLMWGNGFQFHTEDTTLETFLQHLIIDNRLQQKFMQVERLLSMWGVCVVTINRTETGEIKLALADPAYINQVGSVFDEELAAVVYKSIVHSNVTYIYRETWTKDEVRRVGWSNGKEIQLVELLVDVPKELQVKEYEHHGLGFVPVVRFQNIAVYSPWGVDQNWMFYSDDWSCYQLQSEVEDVLCHLKKETEYNKTRVFGAFTPLDMNDSNFIGRKNPMLADFIIQNRDNNNPTGQSNKNFEVMVGDPKFDQYKGLLDWYMDKYITMCGYSPVNQPGSNKGPATATEIVSDNRADCETTRLKRSIRTEDWNRLFRKLVAMAEIGFKYEDLRYEAPFHFEIKEALKIQLPNSGEIDIFEKEVALGVESPITYLMKQKGMTEDQAKEHAEKVQGHNEQYEPMTRAIKEQGEEDTSAKEE